MPCVHPIPCTYLGSDDRIGTLMGDLASGCGSAAIVRVRYRAAYRICWHLRMLFLQGQKMKRDRESPAQARIWIPCPVDVADWLATSAVRSFPTRHIRAAMLQAGSPHLPATPARPRQSCSSPSHTPDRSSSAAPPPPRERRLNAKVRNSRNVGGSQACQFRRRDCLACGRFGRNFRSALRLSGSHRWHRRTRQQLDKFCAIDFSK
jgi:hypothetical protein